MHGIATLCPGSEGGPDDLQDTRERLALEPVGRVACRVAARLVDHAELRRGSAGARQFAVVGVPLARGVLDPAARRLFDQAASRRSPADAVAVACRSKRVPRPTSSSESAIRTSPSRFVRFQAGHERARPEMVRQPGVRPLLGAGRDQPEVARGRRPGGPARGRARPAFRRRTRCRRAGRGRHVSVCAIAITRQSDAASRMPITSRDLTLPGHVEALVADPQPDGPGTAPPRADAPCARRPTRPAAARAARATPRRCAPPPPRGAPPPPARNRPAMRSTRRRAYTAKLSGTFAVVSGHESSSGRRRRTGLPPRARAARPGRSADAVHADLARRRRGSRRLHRPDVDPGRARPGDAGADPLEVLVAGDVRRAVSSTTPTARRLLPSRRARSSPRPASIGRWSRATRTGRSRPSDDSLDRRARSFRSRSPTRGRVASRRGGGPGRPPANCPRVREHERPDPAAVFQYTDRRARGGTGDAQHPAPRLPSRGRSPTPIGVTRGREVSLRHGELRLPHRPRAPGGADRGPGPRCQGHDRDVSPRLRDPDDRAPRPRVRQFK